MSHRTFRLRSDARLHASERRATVLEDVHIGWLSWRLAKSPLLPPRRVAWRPGLGVRRRSRRTHRLAVPVGIKQRWKRGRLVSRFCQRRRRPRVHRGAVEVVLGAQPTSPSAPIRCSPMAERIKMPFLLGERGTQTSPSLQARKGILLFTARSARPLHRWMRA
jgi:hypothetical protein